MKKEKQKALEKKGWKVGSAEEFLGSMEDICAECSRPKYFMEHCKECCGWGVTKKLKYHKFVLKKTKPRSSKSRTRDSRS